MNYPLTEQQAKRLLSKTIKRSMKFAWRGTYCESDQLLIERSFKSFIRSTVISLSGKIPPENWIKSFNDL